MSDDDCVTIDPESLEELFEPTVEVPAALFLAAGCCCGCGMTAGGPSHAGCC